MAEELLSDARIHACSEEKCREWQATTRPLTRHGLPDRQGLGDGPSRSGGWVQGPLRRGHRGRPALGGPSGRRKAADPRSLACVPEDARGAPRMIAHRLAGPTHDGSSGPRFGHEPASARRPFCLTPTVRNVTRDEALKEGRRSWVYFSEAIFRQKR